MNVIIFILTIAMILLVIFIVTKKSSSSDELQLFDTLNPLFTNNREDTTYEDFTKRTGMRNPLLYFELYQMYRYKGKVDISDYKNLLDTLKTTL